MHTLHIRLKSLSEIIHLPNTLRRIRLDSGIVDDHIQTFIFNFPGYEVHRVGDAGGVCDDQWHVDQAAFGAVNEFLECFCWSGPGRCEDCGDLR